MGLFSSGRFGSGGPSGISLLRNPENVPADRQLVSIERDDDPDFSKLGPLHRAIVLLHGGDFELVESPPKPEDQEIADRDRGLAVQLNDRSVRSSVIMHDHADFLRPGRSSPVPASP